MAIIKGTLTPVDPGALRAGDAISVTHQDETGKCVPALFFSLSPQCSVVCVGTAPRDEACLVFPGQEGCSMAEPQASGMSKKDSLNKIHS